MTSYRETKNGWIKALPGGGAIFVPRMYPPKIDKGVKRDNAGERRNTEPKEAKT